MDPGPAPTETCYRHPTRDTGRHCTRCDRPACPECLRPASVGAHCVECVAATRAPRAERRRVQSTLAGPSLWATKILIGLNLAVFVLAVVDGAPPNGTGAFHARWGLFGPIIDLDGEWWRLVTSGFLHSGFVHLGLNMAALYFLGRIIEPAIGPIRFSLLYLASLLGGSMGALVVDPVALTVGASGAIYGLMGAVVAGMRARRVGLFESGIGGLLLVNLLFTFTVPGISIGGHVGGLVAGAAVGAVALAPGGERRPLPGSLAAVAVGGATLAGGMWAAGTWTAPLF